MLKMCIFKILFFVRCCISFLFVYFIFVAVVVCWFHGIVQAHQALRRLSYPTSLRKSLQSQQMVSFHWSLLKIVIQESQLVLWQVRSFISKNKLQGLLCQNVLLGITNSVILSPLKQKDRLSLSQTTYFTKGLLSLLKGGFLSKVSVWSRQKNLTKVFKNDFIGLRVYKIP